ncbi:type II secretion system F family protein [Geodermatophilus obscurus]|uniref:Type II secretion system F domain protein n=1 Tax=Geodermatophilus obscurus (strain ATCC 25078 / DSM 43160 / JCM 3152 / CCUG 61914 / KCC A-0152 / KCTC 9177 / NBRC 13315 / NRRL B-3577 / G-20) TaxID=526225 RepID=D2SAM9_GEOOG|nr:type II secretion system F family protein [Geodermatophilus obscurus]ADB73958.1 Type II secretion system F domain protein [Geodermatophilus obscurus DSM 43160]
MNATLAGMLLGLAAAAGVLLVVTFAPPFRSVRLVDRLAPYVHDTPPPSRLLGTATEAGLLTAVRRLFGPAVADGARFIDRVLGGRTAVRRRLDALGSDAGVEDFRVEQVVWGGLGLLGAALLATAGSLLAGDVNVLSVALLCVAGLVGGVLGRDWWLTQQVQRREELLLTEFPVVAELLALAVTAGESPTAAIARVTRLSGGELARELGAALGRARAGVPLADALQQVADRTSLDPLARFVDGLLVALERGTPLAEVLRAQAADVREAGKRRLLEAGGRKEIAMMVPVVFLVLPVTVLFALYPGLISIVSLAR